MATWNSNKSFKYDEYTGFDYAKCELTWSYGTVADILIIKQNTEECFGFGRSIPASEHFEYMSREKALALLETLIDWAEIYEREGIVSEMLERRK